MSNVVINGLTAVHAGSNGVLTTSDTCMVPPFCIPYPFTNIAKSTDSAMTATSVNVNGNPACHAKSNFAVSNGDSPGACGGIISGTVNGMAEFITFSNNVFIEGIPAVRQTDKMVSNNKNTSPMPLQQPGAGKPPDVSAEGPKEVDPAELMNKVDFTVAGVTITNMKSLVGVADTSAITEAPLKVKAKESNAANNKTNSPTSSNNTTANNLTPLTDKQKVERRTRIEIYYEELYGIKGTAAIEAHAKKLLQIDGTYKIPTMKQRKANFLKFAKESFVRRPDNYQEGFDDPLSEGPKEGTDQYNLFKEYSETEFGAIMINRATNGNGKKFEVKVVKGKPMEAIDNTIFMPIAFPPPSELRYKTSNQPIYLIATLHHEFEHSYLGFTKNIPGQIVKDERPSVIKMENPVRILNGYEPRYTYTHSDGSFTINMITGTRYDGRWTFDPKDPRKMIKL